MPDVSEDTKHQGRVSEKVAEGTVQGSWVARELPGTEVWLK